MTDKMSRGYEAKLHTREKVLSVEDARKVRKAGELTVEVNVDVSEALTGLKALQREAKKATQELRELETQIGSGYIRKETVGEVSLLEIGDLSKVPTCELQHELERREGVVSYVIPPHAPTSKLIIDDGWDGTIVRIEGPAIVTINKD